MRIKKLLRTLGIFVLITIWFLSGWPQIFNFPPDIQKALAATEEQYAASLLADTGANAIVNPSNILGAPDSLWGGGTVNTNTSWTGRWSMGNPSGAITGTQTVAVLARKGSQSGNPTVAINLYENGSLVQSIVGATSITSTTGQTVSGTFNASVVTNANDVEIEVVSVGAGGAPGSRNSAEIDDIDWTVNQAVTNQITVGSTGSQTASIGIPSTNQYVGGALTFVRTNLTADVTSITLSEAGTVNANSNLSNVKLYYKQEVSCSASIPGDATLFNSTAGTFNASEDSTVTGTMTVGTSQICVYVQLDIGSGATDGQTLDIEITNPSTEVSVSSGTVAPAIAVAISGATTLNLLPNVFQDHYRWRNDDGPEGDTNQTLYFNPTGNGFAQNFTIAAGCTAGSEWDCVDDGSADTSTTAPTSDTETSELLLAAATDYYTLANDALPAGVTVTQLDITVAGADDVGNPNTSVTLGYCIVGGANDCGTSDTMGSAQNITGADQTKTEQFTGLSLSTTDMNNMQLVLTGSGAKAQISTLYVLVTYTVPAATWAQAEDAVHTGLAKSTNIRLRFQVDNTGGSASAYNYRLEWAAQSGTCDTAYSGESYAAVPDTATTEHFDMTLSGSSLYVDGDPTTAQLSNAEAFSFIAGDQVESTSNQSGAITLAQNEYTELEYVFQANANATDGGVYCFRVTNAGTVLDSASQVAQVTLAGGAVVSISVTSDGIVSYGILAAGASQDTTSGGLNDTQTAKNDSTIAENFNIKTSNATGGTQWTLGATPGSDIFVHEFSTNGGGAWTKFTTADSYQALATGIAALGTQDFDLRITVPSSTTDYQQKSITITVQAVAQ